MRKKLIDTIEKHKAGTSHHHADFFTGLLCAKPGRSSLTSLKMVVTGCGEIAFGSHRANSKPNSVIQVSEGYGMTEASPVVATNLLDEPPSADESRRGPGDGVIGSVGPDGAGTGGANS